MQFHAHEITRIEVKPLSESKFSEGTGWRDIILHTANGQTLQITAYGNIENLQMEVK